VVTQHGVDGPDEVFALDPVVEPLPCRAPGNEITEIVGVISGRQDELFSDAGQGGEQLDRRKAGGKLATSSR
jgi:hypothetical protein